MKIIYQVRTCHSLPNSRKYFECWCDAKKYIKDMLSVHAEGNAKEDLMRSFHVISIDAKTLERDYKIFPQDKELEEFRKKCFNENY